MALFPLPEVLLFAIFLLLVPATSSESFEFRNMSTFDIEAVASTVMLAFDPGTINTYLYQFRDRFPNYHLRCYQAEVEKQYQRMKPMNHYMVIVPSAETSGSARSVAQWAEMTKGISEPREEEIRASALLALGFGVPEDLITSRGGDTFEQDDLPGQGLFEDIQSVLQAVHDGTVSDIELPCSLHLDMNLIRALHLSRQFLAADEQYIKDAYEYQLYLGLLATHPDWDGHGFAAAQLRWGMELAKSREKDLLLTEGKRVKIPVTLIATPAGYPLYKSMGFESVSNITLELLENFNGGTTWVEYMVWWNDEAIS